MKQTLIIIDIFVDIVDNYGDMGFTCECIMALESKYPGIFDCVIWTNDTETMKDFARSFGMRDILILDISEFGISRKSNLAISMLHASIPNLDLFSPQALILRIDYISLDPFWIQKNETEHISSTENRQIIELIPSPLSGSAGLLPLRILDSKNSQKHITVFCYTETFHRIDWDTFPDDIIVYVFGKVDSKKSNIIHLDFLQSSEFYSLLDSSEFVIIRGEVSFAHMIQSSVPFFWDMYRGIGGFPYEQSEQFLSFLSVDEEYRGAHQILNGQKAGIISYQNIIGALSHTRFGEFRTQNLIHTVKKHIDRFYNSI